MRRKLFTLAAGVSAALCVGVCVLWVRSYRVADVANWRDGGWYLDVAVSRGIVRIDVLHFIKDSLQLGSPRELVFGTLSPRSMGWRFGGFNFARGEHLQGIDAHWWEVRIPLWFVGLLLLPLPIRWFLVIVRANRRVPTGRCAACGYDLRATPDRCPECGAVPTEPEKAHAVSGG